MELEKLISKKDAIHLLEIIYDTTRCNDTDYFTKLLGSVQDLVPFDCLFAAYGEILGKEFDFFSFKYPIEYLDVYFAKNYQLIDPIAKEIFKNFDLLFWKKVIGKQPSDINNPVFLLSSDFGLSNGFTYAVRDFKSTWLTSFSLAGDQIHNNDRTRYIIKLLVPHLGEAYDRLVKLNKITQFSLSKRETEVLKWLKEGKSSWEISRILARSERVINFHVSNILGKLNAENRTHAVAIALRNGLIDM